MSRFQSARAGIFVVELIVSWGLIVKWRPIGCIIDWRGVAITFDELSLKN